MYPSSYRRTRLPYPATGASWSGGYLSLVVCLVLAGGASILVTPSERTITGRAYAVDGDTIRIDGARIRIRGIDAPELSQSCVRNGEPFLCGEKARDALLGMILRRTVECRTSGRDRYQRLLARCFVDGEDLGARMVAEGFAVAYGDYRLLEAQARLRSRGIWSATFERPREWRRHHPF